ncbi:LacI family DNA-binding transcriptional regulator [Gracilibacillus salinarum]|uniref:LacI family transcriptional regulator n=1 Tax=Gracilibacillus salinarum TaxID=2932255 RepID=A0ABY4GUF1_9BACI|nr:LacI family DNA-binding transcriptional regulator [Gracilibacillus salinarum]UOQ86827.1 LacI family transcriptional regulator [Gracilibacillus salinarum]
MSVTIKDVAKKAGVAASTVSRVLSDSPKISEKTKNRVRSVMEELGYHLNENARNLVQQSTKTIGIVMKNSASESLHDPFFPEVLRGISAYCNKQDYSISITTGESEEAIFKDVVKMVKGKKVDGLIVSYSKKDDQVISYLQEADIPFVVVGKPFGRPNEILYVDNDNVLAAKEATEHLITLGHREIGFISGNKEFEVTDARLHGYQDALRNHQLNERADFIKNPASPEVVRESMQELMQLPTTPTALVVTDDLFAMHILFVLRELAIQVPEEMSVISFNNTIFSRFSNPPLTSVDTQIYQLGFEAARCLIDEIKEPSVVKRSVIIPTFIEERESSISSSQKA